MVSKNLVSAESVRILLMILTDGHLSNILTQTKLYCPPSLIKMKSEKLSWDFCLLSFLCPVSQGMDM